MEAEQTIESKHSQANKEFLPSPVAIHYEKRMICFPSSLLPANGQSTNTLRKTDDLHSGCCL
ncbi:hypothetical protein TSUD_200490 [Trifolium subterraneum]|nr:hypothetical protein TSUD_200490 [Trifolium subterraneum]